MDKRKTKKLYKETLRKYLARTIVAEDDGLKKLNLGCGNKRYDFWENYDFDDINLDVFPYKLQSDKYDIILLKCVLEHLHYPDKAIQECYRLLKPNGKIIIQVPYYTGTRVASSVQHRQGFNIASFDNIKKDTGLDFEVYAQLLFPKGLHIFGNLFDLIFNIKSIQKIYENTILRFVFPADHVNVVLCLVGKANIS